MLILKSFIMPLFILVLAPISASAVALFEETRTGAQLSTDPDVEILSGFETTGDRLTITQDANARVLLIWSLLAPGQISEDVKIDLQIADFVDYPAQFSGTNSATLAITDGDVFVGYRRSSGLGGQIRSASGELTANLTPDSTALGTESTGIPEQVTTQLSIFIPFGDSPAPGDASNTEAQFLEPFASSPFNFLDALDVSKGLSFIVLGANVGDPYALDDVGIRVSSISEVPIPPAALMMIALLMGFVGFSMRAASSSRWKMGVSSHAVTPILKRPHLNFANCATA